MLFGASTSMAGVQSSNFLWISSQQDYQYRPDVVYVSPYNRFLVVWRARVANGVHQTFGRFAPGDGVVKDHSPSALLTIGPAAPFKGDVGHVAIAYSTKDQQALVVWTQSAAADRQKTAVFGRFVKWDGQLVGSTFPIGQATGWPDAKVKVAWDHISNRYLVVSETANASGSRTPHAALLGANGSTIGALDIPGPKPDEDLTLYAVAANAKTGGWMIAYDKYFRLMDSNAKLISSAQTLMSTVRIQDVFSTPDGKYHLLKLEPFQVNQQRLFAHWVSHDGKNSGIDGVLTASTLISDAQSSYDSARNRWLALYTHPTVDNREQVLGRSVVLPGNVVDWKPGGVVESRYYFPKNGTTASAVNALTGEVLVVWSYRRLSPAGASMNRDYITGKIVNLDNDLITVLNEEDERLSGAEVWMNDIRIGQTNSHGWINKNVTNGDTIVAKHVVHRQPSKKGSHQPFGGYTVWQTNAQIRDDGKIVPHFVTDTSIGQRIRLSPRNALFGFHLIVSLQWDASQSELDYVRDLIRQASNRIYNATDGQFYIEHITLGKNRAYWADADMRVLPGTGISRALNHIAMTPSYIEMYRLGQGGSIDAGTYTHELLHYLANLQDEYEETTEHGQTVIPAASICTQKVLTAGSGPYGPGGLKASCPLSGRSDTPELCTNLAENPHNTRTLQGGQSCWDRLYDSYMDKGGWAKPAGRWELRRPTDRGRVVPGPDKLPKWAQFSVTEAPDDVASKTSGLTAGPYVYVVARHPNGTVMFANLWLEAADGIRTFGATDRDGNTRMPPTTKDQRLHATALDPETGSILHGERSCASIGEHCIIDLQPQTAELKVSLRPLATRSGWELLIDANTELTDSPSVIVTRSAGLVVTDVPVEPVEAARIFRGIYRGHPEDDQSGVIWVRASTGFNETAVALVRYRLNTVTPEGGRRLLGGDDGVVLRLPEDIEPGIIASLMRTSLPQLLPPYYRLIGGPYELASSSPAIRGILRLYALPLAGSNRSLTDDAVLILRWCPGKEQWEPMPSIWHKRLGYVGASVRWLDDESDNDPRTVYAAVQRRRQ